MHRDRRGDADHDGLCPDSRRSWVSIGLWRGTADAGREDAADR